MTFWWAVAVFATVGVVMVLLGAQPLNRTAENLGPSALRTVALAITRPLADASGFLHLDWPRQQVASGGSGSKTQTSTPGTTVALGASAATTTTVASGGSPSGTTTTTLPPGLGTTTSTVTSTTTTTTVTSTTTTTVIPVFTKADQLRVLVVGDSLVSPVGFALMRRGDTYPALKIKAISKASSGLVRPDFYDWPKVMGEAVADFHPQVTVIMFGGNEKQPMRYQGQVLQPFSDAWNTEYARRVREAIELSTTAGGTVIWIGLPIMRSSKFSETARTLNAFYATACAENQSALYVDGYTLFADAGGRFSPYLPDSAGKNRLMRESDGIHFTDAGGDRIAEAVMNVLLGRYRLE